MPYDITDAMRDIADLQVGLLNLYEQLYEKKVIEKPKPEEKKENV